VRRTFANFPTGPANETLGSASFVRRGCCDVRLAKSASHGKTCCWFRCEFGLDQATCTAIEEAQAEFNVACERHCADVAAAEKALASLPTDALAERRAAAEAAVKAAEAHCREAREAHVRRLAAMMPPEAGKRYLDIALARLAKLDHSGSHDAAGHR
jgi:hypothetical protein